jgi:hypothetical protein
MRATGTDSRAHPAPPTSLPQAADRGVDRTGQGAPRGEQNRPFPVQPVDDLRLPEDMAGVTAVCASGCGYCTAIVRDFSRPGSALGSSMRSTPRS